MAQRLLIRLTMPNKILIVEDNPHTREILKTQVQALTYDVIEAESGEEGLKRALSDAPNLIIMDLGLPGMNGIETTAKLKRDPKISHIPVVAYTAWRAEDYREKAEDAGMGAYLTKPAPRKILQEVIQRFLQTNA